MPSPFSRRLRAFLPPPPIAGRAERLRASLGALTGLALCAVLLTYIGDGHGSAYLIAPMGASAILLFGLPASPMAQPWAVLGGNVLSALVGVACAQSIGAPLVAAPVAVCLAILAMFALRCLHPPGGSVAALAVLGGAAVRDLGYGFAFAPVGLDMLLLVLAAVLFNNLTGRRYPHLKHSPLANRHATADPAPTSRLGFTAEDLDAALQRYGQVLDISRDDLETILLDTEVRAVRRRVGAVTCGQVMSRDVLALRPDAGLAEAWRMMVRHRVHALPVLDALGNTIGMVSQGDLLRHGGPVAPASWRDRLRLLLRGAGPVSVAQIMSASPVTAMEDTPVADLVPLMANTGLHHIPVLDAQRRCVGIVTQSDVVAALFEHALAGR